MPRHQSGERRQATLSQADIDRLKATFQTYAFDVLGLVDNAAGGQGIDLEPYNKAIDLLLELRKTAQSEKNWAMSDLIRNKLSEYGFDVKDTKGWL